MDTGLCRCGSGIELVILKDGDLFPDIGATTSVSECLNEAAPRFPCPLALLECITYLHECIGTILRLARRLVELLEGIQSHIEPWAWLVNRSLLAAGTRDPLLRQRLEGELRQIERIRDALAQRVFIIPWQAIPPVGLAALRRLTA